MTSAEADDDGHVGTTPATDIVAGVVLAALAVAALLWVVPAQTEPGGGGHDVAPAFFPNLAAGLVLVLAATLVATGTRRHLAGVRDGAAGRRLMLDLLVWAAAAAATVVGLQQIGFVATGVVVVAAWMLLAGQRRWPVIVAAAVLFPLAVDGAAWVFFTVDLP